MNLFAPGGRGSRRAVGPKGKMIYLGYVTGNRSPALQEPRPPKKFLLTKNYIKCLTYSPHPRPLSLRRGEMREARKIKKSKDVKKANILPITNYVEKIIN